MYTYRIDKDSLVPFTAQFFSRDHMTILTKIPSPRRFPLPHVYIYVYIPLVNVNVTCKHMTIMTMIFVDI